MVICFLLFLSLLPPRSFKIFLLEFRKFYILFLFFLLFLREGKGGRRRGRETSMCERDMDQLPLARPQPGTKPATQAHALTRNQTSELSLCGMKPIWTTPLRAILIVTFILIHLQSTIFYLFMYLFKDNIPTSPSNRITLIIEKPQPAFLFPSTGVGAKNTH